MDKKKSRVQLDLHVSKLTLLIVTAAAVVIALLLVSPVRSASTNLCTPCHALQNYGQILSFSMGSSENQIPSTIYIGETKTVTLVLKNQANAPSNTILSSAFATLESQWGRFSIKSPTYSIGNFPNGTVKVTWQITGVSAGADLLIISASATNSHMNLQFADTYSPVPSITILALAPTPPAPTPTPTPSPTPTSSLLTPTPMPSAVPSESPFSTPGLTTTPLPTSTSSYSPFPIPTLTPQYNPTPTTSNPGQTLPQTLSPNPTDTLFSSAPFSFPPGPDISSPPSPKPVSNLPFSVLLFSPAGGETWQTGTRHQISWTVLGSSGSLNVNLEYSISGDRGPWTAIPGDLSNLLSFEWLIPEIHSTNCFIRVSVSDSINPTQIISTISAAPFAVDDTRQSSTITVVALSMFMPLGLVIAFFIGWKTAGKSVPPNIPKPYTTDVAVGVMTRRESLPELADYFPARPAITYLNDGKNAGSVSVIRLHEKTYAEMATAKTLKKSKESRSSGTSTEFYVLGNQPNQEEQTNIETNQEET